MLLAAAVVTEAQRGFEPRDGIGAGAVAGVVIVKGNRCTERSEGGEAYRGDETVIDSMRDELTAIAGSEVYVELTRRLETP